MAISSGKDPFWTAKRGIVQNGLVLNLDAAVTQSYPGTGTVWRDLSGFNNHGTLTNGPIYQRNNGGIISCDGVDDYIIATVPTTLLLSQSITFNFWAINPSGGSWLAVLSNNSNINTWLGFNNSGPGNLILFNRSDVGGDSSTSTPGPSFNSTTWRMITGISTPSNMLIYVNGSLSKSFTRSGGTETTLNRIAMGALFRGAIGPQGFTLSQFGNLTVYNRALSASEITQNFNVTRNRFGV